MIGAKRGIVGREGGLPEGWALEGVSSCSVLGVASENGSDVLGLRLASEEPTKFFGIQLHDYMAVPIGSTARTTIHGRLPHFLGIRRVHLVLREWIEHEQCCYQTQKVWDPHAFPDQGVSVYLTVRDAGRLVQPVLQFEAVSGAASVVVSFTTVSSDLL